jgi:hypothetical protein
MMTINYRQTLGAVSAQRVPVLRGQTTSTQITIWHGLLLAALTGGIGYVVGRMK